MPAHPDLIAHSRQFPRQIITLAPGIHAAIGFAASNVYMIEGPDSIAIIDTSESTGAATNILTAFRALTAKPVTTILYTHSHRDHISGASVFAQNAEPQIIASHLFASDLIGTDTGPHAALMDRTRRQFGFGLSFPDERVNLGCGPGDRPMQGMGAGHLPPTRLIHKARETVDLAGIKAELIHAPGETPDHLVVWLPHLKLLFSGDNFYHAFPNLYAIRGTPYRDFATWADTLDMLADLNPAILCPGHTLPVLGAAAINERLISYRDAIRFVIDATAAAMNQGQGPDALAASLHLPDTLATKPWLQEFYGKLAWSARAYFAGTLGWFDGNPTNLDRLGPAQEAQRIIALAGGPDALLRAAETSTDPQWTLELADRLLAANLHTTRATALKATALRAKADTEINATARNYYLTSAKDLDS